jgi:hypothetical protein
MPTGTTTWETLRKIAKLYGGRSCLDKLEESEGGTKKTSRVAQRVFWWDDPAGCLDLPGCFIAQIMMFGSDEDQSTVASESFGS